MIETRQKFFPSIAGLRTVMASLVFLYHYYTPQDFNFTPVHLIVLLRYRMTIFFVISGFVIMYSLLPYKQITKSQYINFIIGKLVRLFPLYLAILIIPYFEIGIPPLHLFLSNLTLTKGFFKDLYLSGIGPSWSLTVEITFYFLAPLLLILFKRNYGLLISYSIIILMGIVFTIVGFNLKETGYNFYGFFADYPFTLNSTFFGRATDFYAGILIAWNIYHPFEFKLTVLKKINKTYLGFTLIILITFLIHSLEREFGEINLVLSLLNLHFLLPLAVGLFIFGLINEQTLINDLLSLKTMVWLGNGSYAFYLMHTSWVQYKLSQISPLPDNGFLFLWATAMFSFYFFEKPVTSFLRAKTKI